MKNYRILLAIGWLTGIAGVCSGQMHPAVKFQSYSARHGLPASEVNRFSEDETGFLWVATYDGVCQFDGVTFKPYRLPVVDSSRVSGSNVVVHVQCWQKEVWCLNWYGQFFRLDRSKDAFAFVGLSIHLEAGKKINMNALGFAVDTSRGIMWVSDARSLFKYNFRSGQQHDALPLRDREIGPPVLDRQGRIWCAAERGEVCFDPQTGSKIIFFESVEFTAQCRQGSKIWCMGSTDTLYFVDTETHRSGFVPTNARAFFKNQVPDCIQDMRFGPVSSGDSLLWLSTCQAGLLAVNSVTGQYIAHFNTDNYENKGFLNDWINTSLVTRDGCLWLGTQKGVLKMDPRQLRFFTEEVRELKKLQIFRIRQVRTDPAHPAEQWLATGDGLFLYHSTQKRIVDKFLQADETIKGSWLWADISTMEFDSAGNLWLGTKGGLARLDRSRRLKRYEDQSVANKGIRFFVQIEKDAFWVSNNNGAGLYWPERGKYFPVQFPLEKDAKPVGVHHLNAGLHQSALFSSEVAVWRANVSDFDPACNCFPRPEPVLRVGLPDDLLENDTAIWVYLPTGLTEFHKQNGTLRTFGAKEGLSNMRVRSILEGQNGEFWMNSDNGLFVFHPKHGRFKKYSEEDGLENNFMPGILSRDGDVFHAGFSYAFSTFSPNARLLKTHVTPQITNVFALNKRLPTDFSGAGAHWITVQHVQNILRFEFTCPDFYQSEKITFQYKLEGFDPAPVEAGFSRSAVYTNLDGGQYRFLVWATNADGFAGDEAAVVWLRVVPPFYRTWWFYSLCVAAVGAFFYAIFRYREIQRLRQERLRLHIARDLHDEVGSTLSSISILSASALHGVQKDLDAARFGNIGDKARAALDSISDIVWSVNPENDSMEKTLARMSAYAADMLENAGAELRFEVGPGMESLALPMEKRKDFYLIFKEAIHNCAKYACARQVRVEIKKENNFLIMQIKDDGIGLEVEKLEPGARSLGGNGFRNMQSRAVALGGRLEVISRPGAGMELCLSFPLFA